MNPSRWPDWLEHVWAKSKQEGQDQGESLAQHTWNVLERFAELAHLRPSLADSLTAPDLWHCLFWTCFLHDFGKAADGFQVMLRGGERWKERHEVLSLAFLSWIAPALSEAEQKWIVAAIVSHHRDEQEISAKYDEYMDPDPLVNVVGQLDEREIRGLWRWLNECASAWIDALGLYEYGVRSLAPVNEETAVRLINVEGIEQTRTWLTTYRKMVNKLPSERDQQVIGTLVTLRGLTTTADHMASAHLHHVPQGIQRSWEQFVHDDLKLKETYQHQRTSAASSQTSRILIAPTGSGKTEAALCWAMGDGSASSPRIFYALPYQASMNAMYDRLRSPRYFGDATVGLQHGRALQALYQRMMDAERGPTSALQDAKWRENLTRLHACPIKVFSPYQMMKVVYQIKGFEGMLTDYTQAAFIFDEIHAYDPDRLAIILCLVKYLRERWGARFFMMSATFPRILQDILSQVIGAQEPIVAEPDLFKQFQRHHLRLLDGDLLEQGIDRIVEDVEQGKSVLVCCNTVQRAQDVQALLLERLSPGQVELIHSRFTMRDRLTREKDILARCAIGTQHSALAVVATQVIEVSLNIDLDTIYSDPAPLEALVQRFGRVNRACTKGIVPVHVFRQPSDGQHVYSELLVQKTLSVLEAQQDRNIDEAAVSTWLDEIYDTPAIQSDWRKRYDSQFQLVSRLLNGLRPFNSDKESEAKFEQLFDGVEVLPACFEQEYVDRIAHDDFLEASRLFVSISQKKYQQLARQGKIRSLGDDRHKKWIVKQPYSSEHGLLFDTFSQAYSDGD